tara:strand:+ start:229 stop:489 length:261 start_codon:yes stop_codon:yes gene_type:complete
MKEVIKFHAEWCSPCRYYKTVWNEAKEKLGSVHKFIEVDIDNDTTGLADKFGVRGVPTTVVVESNKDFQKQVGALTYGDLEKLIKG